MLKHPSSSFVEQLGTKYGAMLAENGGYWEFHVKCEGQPRPRWDAIIRYLLYKADA